MFESPSFREFLGPIHTRAYLPPPSLLPVRREEGEGDNLAKTFQEEACKNVNFLSSLE